ncbi:dolichol phosphate-mannose biosynthesis regulatory protein [Myxozyma melibiosi]|uniref:Dolichol phosphate-mannose biosynthesis regulatory protein n=1 Tax=Myxozyma melibiosi TaxID=54550 RepID=A0ABR1F3L9_9ASCO
MGFSVFFISTFAFVYYTAWTLLMPFVDTTHPIQNFFPSREWAIKIPVLILLLIMGTLGSFLGVSMINYGKRRELPST